VERDPFHLVQRAWAAYEAKHYDLAEREARAALAIDPNNANALSLLSICATERKDRASAVQLAQEAIALAGDEAIYHYRLALVHSRFGDHKAAEPPLRTALRLAPNFALAYSLLAWVFFARRRFKKALIAINDALKLDPHEPHALSLRVQVFQATGDHAGARSAALEALQVDPQNVQAHSSVGMIELRKRNHDKAASHLSAALARSPHLQSVQKAYAEARESQDETRRALLKAYQHFSQPILATFWPFCWLLYLLAREFEGPVVYWHWAWAAAAVAFHGLLIWGWWGPLFSYAHLQDDPELRRIAALRQKPLDRARLGPWQIIMSAAIAVSTISLVFPGNSFSVVTGVLVFAGFVLLLTGIALQYPREAILVALVVFVVVSLSAAGVFCVHFFFDKP
jgi:tetratricopeptide (TPR) repeat protein